MKNCDLCGDKLKWWQGRKIFPCRGGDYVGFICKECDNYQNENMIEREKRKEENLNKKRIEYKNRRLK